MYSVEQLVNSFNLTLVTFKAVMSLVQTWCGGSLFCHFIQLYSTFRYYSDWYARFIWICICPLQSPTETPLAGAHSASRCKIEWPLRKDCARICENHGNRKHRTTRELTHLKKALRLPSSTMDCCAKYINVLIPEFTMDETF